jgi:hypothetical protein
MSNHVIHVIHVIHVLHVIHVINSIHVVIHVIIYVYWSTKAFKKKSAGGWGQKVLSRPSADSLLSAKGKNMISA